MLAPFSYIAPSISRRKSALMVAPLEGVEEMPGPRRGAPRREREAGGERVRQPLDGEELVPVRPREAAEHLACADVDGVYAADALVEVETRGVLAEPRQHPRCPDEGDVPVEREAARPAREARDRREAPVLDDADLAVAAI